MYRRERDSLEGPHEEAEIQRKALRRGKNLAFSEDTCLEKERVQSKVTPRKVGSWIKIAFISQHFAATDHNMMIF